ncbi:MAG: 4-hydroxy-tetrahydrodipicolinate reductase [Cyclobacteriaceae bacterium]|nr:4-hydroxy-tetrahydrodipicolinate reductase [Cyclobacteriaceae bacterium]
MDILLIGYGKMGKTIEEIALERGHRIIEKIDVHNQDLLNQLEVSSIDAAIEFSQPEAAFENIKTCIDRGIKIISGTTGWLDKRSMIETLCREKQGTFFYASNFSIGVNLFFRLNNFLAELITDYGQYGASLEEIHHTEKKDAPSGTAITLAEGIIDHSRRIKKWEKGKSEYPDVLGIESYREGKVPGTHVVRYKSGVDQIEIRHEAFSRKGFALGAVLVAEWIGNHSGMLTMDDFLGF